MLWTRKVPKVLHGALDEDAYDKEIETIKDIIDIVRNYIWTKILIVQLLARPRGLYNMF